jgi:hypothetical protein
MLMMDPAERERVLAAVRAYLDTCPETSAGEFTLPIITAALRTTRL